MDLSPKTLFSEDGAGEILQVQEIIRRIISNELVKNRKSVD